MPFGSVNSVEDLSKHPALRRITVDTSAGPVSLTAPATYYEGDAPAGGAIPDLDEHGETIRKEFAA